MKFKIGDVVYNKDFKTLLKVCKLNNGSFDAIILRNSPTKLGLGRIEKSFRYSAFEKISPLKVALYGIDYES